LLSKPRKCPASRRWAVEETGMELRQAFQKAEEQGFEHGAERHV